MAGLPDTPHPQAFVKDDRLVYDNAEYLDIYVTRAAKDGSWIDVFCYDNHTRTSWSKRMKLPLPAKWSKAMTDHQPQGYDDDPMYEAASHRAEMDQQQVGERDQPAYVRYESCVTDGSGRCTRFSHDHSGERDQ